MTVSGRKPCALTLPHKAPSVAIRTGSGVTLSAEMPSRSRCAIQAAWALWMLGYPDRAAARSQEALALARSLDHPFSVSYVCHLASGMHQWRREHQIVQELEDEALARDREHGFGLLLTAGVIQRGWCLASLALLQNLHGP